MISLDIGKEEVKKFKYILDYFKRLAEDGVTPLIEKQLLLMLDNSLPFFSETWGQTYNKFSIFQR